MASLLKVPLSDDLLQKYGGMQADIYTIAVGIRIGNRFALGTKGQRVVAEALNNLPSRASCHSDMTFGFGDSHILRDPNINEEGFVFAALCGVLGEHFPTQYAAQVLGRLANHYNPEASCNPHIEQWGRMVMACNGMFALTDLAVSGNDGLQRSTLDHSFVKTLPQPQAFAQALASFAELTQNSESRLMLVGGEVIKWFVMISTRLFDLSVNLIDDSGTQSSIEPGTRDAQLVLVYTQNFTSTTEWTSYKINNKVVLEPVLGSSQWPIDVFPHKTRTTWDNALSNVFGQAYVRLVHTEEVATAIGSIARIFEGLANGETDLDINLVSQTSRVTTASYGGGLVSTIINYFPELSRHAGKMQRMSKQTWAEAASLYPQTMRQIERNCACNICTPESSSPPKEGFCRSVLLETVVAMALVLSRTILTPGLFPSQSGIGIFYDHQTRKKINVRKDSGIAVFSTIYGDGWNASDAMVLQQCIRIFAGCNAVENLPDDIVALSHEGVCAYLIKLEGAPRADDPGGSSLVRVIPGVIQQKSKVYTCVRECAHDEPPDDSLLWEELNIKSSSGQLYARS